MTPSVFPRRPAALLLLSCVFLAGCENGAGEGAASPGGGRHPLVGSPAPDFDLPAQSGGKRASLSDARGKVALVDFWATWCEPCRASFPKYEALRKRHEDDLVIFGIAEDDEGDGIQGFAEETGAKFLLAWDASKRVAQSYRPPSMPTSYVIDGNGLVRFVHTGFREGDEAEIEKQIRSLVE